MTAKKKVDELRNVTKKTHGGKKMRKKKTIISKKKKQNKVINILKDSVSFKEYVLRRNERVVKQEEEDVETPKYPCVTCRYYVQGRCERLGRPITEPFTTKCFDHSLYPNKEPVYLAHENIEADIIQILFEDISENVS